MTLAVRVIPCLDVHGGRVVKGINFQDLRDAGDPVELAKVYDAEGADELTFLDISASHEGRATTMDVVSRCAEEVFIPLTVGGGVSSVDDVDRLLRAGADEVAVNTAAIHRPELVAEIADRFGNQVLVLSVDARRTGGDQKRTASGFEVTTHGGRKSAGLDADGTAPEGSTFVSRTTPIGTKTTALAGNQATVSVWCGGLLGLAGTDSTTPVTDSWFTITLTLQWTADDWKIVKHSQKDGPAPVPGDNRASGADEIAKAIEGYGGFTYAR